MPNSYLIAMRNKRLKRLVSLAISLCTIALFVVKLQSGSNEQKPWGMLLARGFNDKRAVNNKRPPPDFSSILSMEQAAEVNELRVKADPDDDDVDLDDDEDLTDELHVKLDDEDDEGDEMTVGTDTVDHALDEADDNEDGEYNPLPDEKDYSEISSLTSADRTFYPIYFGGDTLYNPSIIPHPTRHDLWIVVAQHEQTNKDTESEELMTCTAGFYNGLLVCTAPATVLPVTKSITGQCRGAIEYFNLRGGPRDARSFYGPDAPYIMYGSQSSYTCLGLWLQDLRMLLQDYRLEQMTLVKLFKKTTEIQRPPPIKEVEKNFFLFWDSANKAYAHHDIYPTRSFAQLSYDGSVGPDLAPASATKDGICMAKYMPTIESSAETIHQATNSLSITMCNRNDPLCVPTDANTFIMTIFQHKSYYDFHSIYEPYIMLFQRSAPFAIHAISQRPFWIRGRGPLTASTHAVMYDQHPERPIPEGHSEMFYITSMSWKTHGQRYHGYMDDPLFLAFGIEDSRPAVIDVTAGDLLQDLGFCSR